MIFTLNFTIPAPDDNPRLITPALCGLFLKRGSFGQCPAKSWMENGTLDTPVEYLCEVAHTQARYLRLIGESEKAWEVTDRKERVKHSFFQEKIVLVSYVFVFQNQTPSMRSKFIT